MANEPKVSVTLTVIDYVTKNVDGVKGALSKLGDAFTSLGVKVAAFAVAAAAGAFFKSAVEEASRAQKGIEFLRQSVNNAGESFADWKPKIDETIAGLSKVTKYAKDDFHDALTNMIAKSGDVAGSLGNLGLVSDVAAKKGIGLAEAGDLVGKAMTGNGRAFKEFGITTGTTAEKMEQLRAATKGYAESELNTFSGRLGQLSSKWQEFKESAGEALVKNEAIGDSLKSLSATIEAAGPTVGNVVASMVNGVVAFVGGLQLLANDAGEFFLRLPYEFKAAWGMLLVAIANTVGESRVLRTLFGDAIDGIADKMGASGTRMIHESGQALGAITVAHQEAANDILGIEDKKTTGMIDRAQKRTKRLTADDEAANKKAIAAADKQDKDLASLHDLAFKSSMTIVTAQHAEYEEAERQFREKMKGMDAAHYAEAETLLQTVHNNQLIKWRKFGDDVAPLVVKPATEMVIDLDRLDQELAAMTGEVVQDTGKWQRFSDAATTMGNGISDAANIMGSFTHALGVADPQLDSVINGVGQLGDALTKVGSGDITGGLTGAIGALGGILGGLFGTSPAEQARRALLAQNSEALKTLHSDYGRLILQNDTGAQISGLQAIGRIAPRISPTGGLLDYVTATDLAGVLAGQGLNLAELDKVASDSGVDLGKKNGRYDLQSVNQFLAGLQGVKVSGFGSGIQGQLDTRAFQNQLAGGSGLTLQDYQDILTGPGGSPFLAQLFQYGSAGLPAALQAAGANINDLSPGALGGVSASQAREILTAIAGLLGSTSGVSTGAPASTGLADTFGSATSGSAGSGFAAGSYDAVLASIADATTRTADSADRLVAVIEGPLLEATQATADAIAGGALLATVSTGLATSASLSGANSGTRV